MPVTGLLLHVPDSNDPNTFRLVEIDDSVRKVFAEVPARWRIESPIPFGVSSDFQNHSFHLIVEPQPQRRIDLLVKIHGGGVFFVRLRMKNVRLHAPNFLRRRAETSSPGMPSIFPL